MMTDKFIPPNTSELESIISDCCSKCTNDRAANGSKAIDECNWDDFCPILASVLSNHEFKPTYPSEWTYDDAGNPWCTAFDPVEGAPIRRCPFTADIFEEFSDREKTA